MPTVLIVGASRGIGLAMAREFAAAGWQVVATHRGDAVPAGLAAIDGVRPIRLEVTNAADIAALGAGLADTAVDVLIHNAAIGDPEFGLADADPAVWLDHLNINAVAPMMVTAAVLPALLRGTAKKIMYLSSGLASIGEADGASFMVYRMTKAALNMGARYVANAHAGDGVTAVAVSPGWVRTDMGGPSAPTDPADAAADLRRLVDGLTAADNGKFLNFDGAEIPW